MKIYSYSNRNTLILMTTCSFFVSGLTVSQAMSSNTQPRHIAIAGSDYKQPVADSARLIIWRIPNLGNHIVVNLWIDGVAVPGIGYGRTFEGFLRPGRHVLSVRPTPNAKWLIPWEMILDVRNGQTYTFTATGDHSGHLILKEAWKWAAEG